MGPVVLVKSFILGPLFTPHQLSSAVKGLPALVKKVFPFKGLVALLPTNLEYVTDVLPLELIAPPVTAAVLPVKALVVTVNGPLSTTIAPPRPADAELLEKVELLTL